MAKVYVVFQDGKRLSEYNIKGWERDTFLSFKEAVKRAYQWAYPLEESDINTLVSNSLSDWKLGEAKDLGMTEVPVLMHIAEEEV